MADPQNDFKPGDNTNVILRKILDRLTTVAAGSGGGGGTVTILPGDVEIGAVELKNGADDTRAVILASAPVGTEAALVVRNIPSGTQPVSGPLTDTQLRASAVPISAAALPLPAGASTEVTLAALSAKVTAVNTGAVVLAAGAAAIGSVSVSNSVTVTGPLTDTQLRASAVPVSLAASTTVIGNVGGKTASIKDTTAVSTSPAYTIGDAVGGKRTLANALTSVGTGVLESIHLLDRANQALGLVIYIFDSDPAAATITDNSPFVFSTDDLKVLAVIVVATTDWTTVNGKAMCSKVNLGAVLKSAGTSLYAAVVCTSAPTFVATSDVQLVFGILQD